VIIGLVIIFVQVQTKFSNVSTLGEHQIKILNTNNEMNFFESYLRTASKASFDSALLDILNAKISSSQTEEINPQECTAPRLPETFEPELTNRFNYYLKPYLSYLGEDEGFEPIETDFLLGVDGTNVIVSATKPVIINFVDDVGQFSYRPVIEIDRGNKLREYENWADTIKTITTTCDKNPNPAECGKIFADIREWTIKETATPNFYNLIIPISTQEFWGQTFHQRICLTIKMEKTSPTL
jgi:hypothetical protein